MNLGGAALALVALVATTAAQADHPFARYRPLSAPDCVDASRMVVEYDAAPVDRTYLRVQHMGDPGTPELAGEIANAMTWDAAAFTGLSVAPTAQRGYVDQAGRDVFQLSCADAGFYIDTSTFSHAAPLVGEGPSVSVARDFSQPVPAFAGDAALVVEADIAVPIARPQAPPVADGTAQVGFFVYLRDRTTGTVITQLVGLLDDRAPGVNGSGVEGFGNDGVNAFISSPLAAADATGAPVRFVSAGPGSATMQYVDGWHESRHFVARIEPAQFAAALAGLGDQGLRLSRSASDYDVLSFGVLGEVFPGTRAGNDVALGARVSNLALRSEPLLGLIRLP